MKAIKRATVVIVLAKLSKLFSTDKTAHGVRSPTHQIDDDGVPEEQREAEQHPRQIRSLEAEETEEIHADVRVASAPDVHEHYGEYLAEKHQAYKHCHKLSSPVNEKPKCRSVYSVSRYSTSDNAYFYVLARDKNVNYSSGVSGEVLIFNRTWHAKFMMHCLVKAICSKSPQM